MKNIFMLIMCLAVLAQGQTATETPSQELPTPESLNLGEMDLDLGDWVPDIPNEPGGLPSVLPGGIPVPGGLPSIPPLPGMSGLLGFLDFEIPGVPDVGDVQVPGWDGTLSPGPWPTRRLRLGATA